MGYAFIGEGSYYINESVYVRKLAHQLTTYSLVSNQTLDRRVYIDVGCLSGD